MNNTGWLGESVRSVLDLAVFSTMLACVLFMSLAKACESHFYVRAAAGWSGNIAQDNNQWQNNDDLAAQFDFGYRLMLGESWAIDGKLSHDSNWFVGPPFNNDAESSVDHANIGLEYRW